LNGALFFTNKGKAYQEKVYQIPEAERTAKGIPLRNLIRLEDKERITAALPVADFDQDAYLTMFTAQGRVKRVPLNEFSAVRANGLLAFSLDTDDELGWVLLTDGQQELLVTTQRGKTLRLAETEVTPRGRTAGGVLGIRLSRHDQVACVDVVEPGAELLVVTQNGFGKRSDLSEYPSHGRNTGGVITLHPKYLNITGPVVAARVVQAGDQVTLVTAEGMALHTPVQEIPQSGRGPRGQIVINIYKGDRLSDVARLKAELLEA
jgi:DNA gyrase subunit A